MHIAGNWSVIPPELGWIQLTRASFRSNWLIICFALGAAENGHCTPHLTTWCFSMSTIFIMMMEANVKQICGVRARGTFLFNSFKPHLLCHLNICEIQEMPLILMIPCYGQRDAV